MASSNTAFCFDIVDGTRCYSQQNVVCEFDDGAFVFDGVRISVGKSYGNNYGGVGGFVGPNHEYFVYCGSKYAEIAIARYNKKKDIWEDWAGQTLNNCENNSKNCPFKNIWVANNGLALIFEPRARFRQEITGDKTLKAIRCDLLKRKFNGLTREQFHEQRHSKIDHNSNWPLKTGGESSDESEPPRGSDDDDSIGSNTTSHNGSSQDHVYTKTEVTKMMREIRKLVSTHLERTEDNLYRLSYHFLEHRSRKVDNLNKLNRLIMCL
jgi:hypothetical protein